MKKLLTIMLAGLMAISMFCGLTACSDNDDAKPVILKDVVLLEEQYGIAAKKENEALISKINDALIAICNEDAMQLPAYEFNLNSEIAVTPETINPLTGASDESWNDVVSRGKVLIGYTVFAPIAYDIVDGYPTKGFDIELAKAVFNYLNAEYETEIAIEFLEIEWNSKEALLESGSIDLVWNGLTITPARSSEMCISIPYLNNKQVAVAMSDKDYTDIESLKDAIAGAEDGSAGEEQIADKKIGKEYVKCGSQLEAYNKLYAGTLDVIVIDSVMANYYISLENAD